MTPTLILNNGVEMPRLGLGVYAPAHNHEVQQAVEWSLELGGRLIDTAAAYGNEQEVADGIQAGGVPRNELFITTKVWNDDMGFENTLRAFDESLRKLRTDYVDLYLIHWPVRETRLDTWRALEHIYQQQGARAIGVCNYYEPHLDELLTVAEIMPAVNQIELSPYCYLPHVLDYCRRYGIQPEGYAPLVRGLKQHDPTLTEIAEKYGKSTYQILVRWSLQQGVVTIPKSVKKERIRENFDVFDFGLSRNDMDRLNTLHNNTRIADDPMDYL